METCNECGQQLDGVWVDVRVGGMFYRLCESCGEDTEAPPVRAAAGGRPV